MRVALESGDVPTAISLLNDIDPSILDTDRGLLFELHLQRLIETIRSGDAAAAVDFAKQNLAPLALADLSRLEPLEEAMLLIATCPNPAEDDEKGT